ncbi:MAG TPA: SDR family NAD(P)-dependent oxidoreductase [Acidimicrobiales bacterium]|nr:SDR family NAD(P)-dependent oxidoreductase [Acidimicrobiales bacterium]
MIDALGQPQTAVVLGGTSDIGRAVLRALAAGRLRRVVLTGRDEVGLAAAAKELEALGGIEVDTRISDITDVASHGALARDVKARLGDVDVVIVAAGVLGDQAADEVDARATAQVLDTNFTGPAAALVAFAEMLKAQGHGRLVVLSSVAGVRVRRANYVYGASKAGLDGFAQGMADALRGSGVSLMIVRPGWVDTKMTKGRTPGPLATTADAVAADVVRGLERSATVVWSPAPLRLVFAVMRLLPGAVWRRLPG